MKESVFSAYAGIAAATVIFTYLTSSFLFTYLLLFVLGWFSCYLMNYLYTSAINLLEYCRNKKEALVTLVDYSNKISGKTIISLSEFHSPEFNSTLTRFMSYALLISFISLDLLLLGLPIQDTILKVLVIVALIYFINIQIKILKIKKQEFKDLTADEYLSSQISNLRDKIKADKEKNI